MRERLPRNRDIIVACEMGGSLQPSVASKFGTASRSLKVGAPFFFFFFARREGAKEDDARRRRRSSRIWGTGG